MAGRRHGVPLRVTEKGYEPADEVGRKQHAKMKTGTLVRADIARSRSVAQHARYWSILAAVVTHCPGNWRTPEALHEALKVATGRVEIVQLVNGRLIKIPQSTSFDAMGQDDWQIYHDAAMRVIEDEILEGEMGVDELLAHADGAGGSRDSNAAEAIVAAGQWGG
ncbi:MAG: hypothetical protein P4L90_25900 [Rhodopila sp.]|nr:hypothetical protein [Rhodopila sp.]